MLNLFVEEFKLKDSISIEFISGETAPKDRTKIVSNFNNGKITMLIASDLIARGMDLKVIRIEFVWLIRRMWRM